VEEKPQTTSIREAVIHIVVIKQREQDFEPDHVRPSPPHR
jgi:hypothetical protein